MACATALYKAGASREVKDNEGKTCIEVAASVKDGKMVELLTNGPQEEAPPEAAEGEAAAEGA